MSVSKGYSSKKKLSQGEITDDLFVTVEPVKINQNAQSVLAHAWVQLIGSDAVEADSTVNKIVATGHAAKVGDNIYISSGALDTIEVKVRKVDANNIYLAEDLESVPAVGVTFDILRHRSPRVNDDGDLNVSVTSTGVIAFNRNGAATPVSEDTGVPGNSRPLPVKLVGVTGDVNITAGDLNVALEFANDSCDVSGSTVTANLGATDTAALAAIESDIDTLATATQRTVVGKASLNMAVSNITTAAFVELIANTSNITYKIQVFEGFGAPLIFAVGAAGLEFDTFIIPPGGTEIECIIPSNRRLSVKAIAGTSNSGYIVINLIG